MTKPWFEARPERDGSFDEIVARFADGEVHVEMTSGKGCCVNFYWDDGRHAQWWISSKKKLRNHHEHSITDLHKARRDQS